MSVLASPRTPAAGYDFNPMDTSIIGKLLLAMKRPLSDTAGRASAARGQESKLHNSCVKTEDSFSFLAAAEATVKGSPRRAIQFRAQCSVDEDLWAGGNG